MSHYHLEIIMPPVDDVTAAVASILNPFDENNVDEDGDRPYRAFWDWYVIGGRWAGVKLECSIDPEKEKAFREELQNRKVTVSSVQCGKPSLQPVEQIPMVDALWREFFPDSTLKTCPFFAHFQDQYKDNPGFPDVMALKDVPKELTAHKVMFGLPRSDLDNRMEAEYMLEAEMWNGVNFIDTAWDGKITTAIEKWKEYATYRPGMNVEGCCIPKDDWLAITVDYHN